MRTNNRNVNKNAINGKNLEKVDTFYYLECVVIIIEKYPVRIRDRIGSLHPPCVS
jgi:hypothetical protein